MHTTHAHAHIRMWLRWLPPLVVALVVMGPRLSWACKCGDPRELAFVTTPYVGSSSGLELRSSSAQLRCTGSRKAPVCHYEAHYELHNPTPGLVHTPAVVVGGKGVRARASSAGGMLTDRDAGELSERAVAHALERSGSGYGSSEPRASEPRPSWVSMHAFELVLEPGATLELRVSADVMPTDATCGCGMPSVEHRHFVVSRGLERDYLVQQIEGTGLANASGERTQLVLETPMRWQHGALWDTRARLEHGKRVSRTSMLHGVAWWRMYARPPVQWGGPFVGAGVGWRKDPSLLLRAGWEVARPSWLIASFAVESDAQTHVELVPALEGTFPAWGRTLVLFPVPAFGVGVPVQVFSDVRAGIRSQLALSWPVLSILGMLDVYPEQRGQPGSLYGALMFQLGI